MILGPPPVLDSRIVIVLLTIIHFYIGILDLILVAHAFVIYSSCPVLLLKQLMVAYNRIVSTVIR